MSARHLRTLFPLSLLFMSLMGQADTPLIQCKENPNTTAALPSGDLHLASWNLLKGKLEGWQQVVKQARVDRNNVLFLMQEATDEQRIHDALGLHEQPVFAAGYKAGKTQSGVLTSAAVSPTANCRLQHQEPWLRSPKASLIAFYNIENQQEQLLVANVHGINFTMSSKPFKQQINDILNIIGEHQGPIILAGDFNTWNKTRTHFLQQATEQHGLSQAPFQKDKLKSFAGWPLDHVFYRGLTLQTTHVIEVTSSDHNLLHAHFRI